MCNIVSGSADLINTSARYMVVPSDTFNLKGIIFHTLACGRMYGVGSHCSARFSETSLFVKIYLDFIFELNE